MSEQSIELARRLVGIGAVSFSPAEPYTWASGLLSPMYCDNRQTLAYPDVRALIARAFERVLREQDLRPEAIIGVATGAIAHATVLAERLNLPMGYIRSAAKEHGRQNQVEGFAKEGGRVVVVEDLISTGGSSIAAAKAAAESGLIVEAVLAIFTYGFPMAEWAFAEESIPLFAIMHLDDVLTAAEEAGSLRSEDKPTLHDWKADPVRWSDLRKGER